MAALDCAFELSKLLDCGLDKEALSICVALIENGVNPEVGAAPPLHSWCGRYGMRSVAGAAAAAY